MTTRKKKAPAPNYTIYEFQMGWEGSVWRMWLAESKDFYSEKDLEEITYWENGKCYTIEKYTNEA